jgi:hypothetical protein
VLDYFEEENERVIGDIFENNEEFDLKGRNSKQPKKSNHGARPCSSVMRRMKKSGWYKRMAHE